MRLSLPGLRRQHSNGDTEDARILRRTRLRLMAVSGFVTLLILVILGGAVYAAVSTRFADSDKQQLLNFAAQHHRNGPPQSGSALEVGGTNAGLFLLAVGPDGHVYAPEGIAAVPAGLPDPNALAAAAASSNATDYRYVTTADGSQYELYTEADQTVAYGGRNGPRLLLPNSTVQYVANRTAEAGLLGNLRLILLAGGLLALLAALAAGYFYAGRALVPIRASMARREAALKRQREFTANASHELRTPLTVIRASVTDLMRNRRSRVEDVGEALADIDAEVKHLSALVDDLLLLARTDSGVVQIERQPVDVADVAVEAASVLVPLGDERGVRLELDPLPVTVEGDALRLRQLVTILVDNAIGHSPKGSTVTVRVRPENGFALLQVEDQGSGIKPENMERVFERFWRADDAPAGGTGLGLAIARWIVEQHGGVIGVGNRQEGGARFWARLPTRGARALPPDAPTIVDVPPSPRPAPPTSGDRAAAWTLEDLGGPDPASPQPGPRTEPAPR